MKNELTVRQISILCSIILFCAKLLILPSLLYETTSNISLLVLIVLFSIDFLVLFMFIKIKEKNNNIDFFLIFSQKIGKFLTKIIFFILFLFFVLKIIYVLQESFTFLKQVLYGEATVMIFLIIVIPIINAMTIKGLKPLGRTLEIFYVWIIVGIVFCTTIWLSSVGDVGFNFYNNYGLIQFFKGLFEYSFWFGDFIFLFFFIDKVKIKNGYGNKMVKYFIFSAILCLFFFFSYYFIYQTTSGFHTNAILNLIQFSSELGNVGKLDIFSITTIMFIIFFQLTVFLFCAKSSLEKIIPFSNEKHPIIIINILVIVSLVLLGNNLNLAIEIYKNYLNYLGLFVCYVFPLIVFVLSKNTKKLQKNAVFSKKNVNYLKILEKGG